MANQTTCDGISVRQPEIAECCNKAASNHTSINCTCACHGKFLVRVRRADGGGRIAVVEKAFCSEKIQSRWIDKLSDDGRLIEILGYSRER